MMTRFLLIGAALIGLLTTIVYIFWHEDLRYSQPTPLPAHYEAVAPGSTPGLPLPTNGKPTVLHFFNPECPCSRFNIDHFRALVRRYGDEVNFIAVLQSDHEQTAQEKFADYDLDVEAVWDAKGQWAKQCGVYATPQAVVIDTAGTLFYRGNYNQSRYCTQPSTNYAQQAIERLLGQGTSPMPPPLWPQTALRAYGCQLPANQH
ncbi:Thiol-disulfide isomerase or thioredoxin [Catalinimonas alkaloidigena]|uniref:Thiol-disulfide isomerase or thioredoxin n=1 Tax=Catalinimonas alkaloidigena TaxID=1075417 RepID=A0A1G9J1X8_9BACT|nr:redoxin domain-containing protein [Catalinimonas alkaloidigena]SDL31154.1 Thiol-disulfide isomerase or thioredoxin [Catalinimonas alkaloidigena]